MLYIYYSKFEFLSRIKDKNKNNVLLTIYVVRQDGRVWGRYIIKSIYALHSLWICNFTITSPYPIHFRFLLAWMEWVRGIIHAYDYPYL